MNEEQRLRGFLAEPVPPGGTFEWDVWKAECKTFGNVAYKVCTEIMKTGTDAEQDAAGICLAFCGYEVTVDGFYEDTKYRIRASGATDWITVVPDHPPERLTLDDYAIFIKPREK